MTLIICGLLYGYAVLCHVKDVILGRGEPSILIKPTPVDEDRVRPLLPTDEQWNQFEREIQEVH